MHPLLLKIGSVPIHTYGFMIALGFLIAVATVRILSIRDKLDAERMLDCTFWCMLSGFVGARILFIITRLPYFLSDPGSMFRVWEGGLVFWGGPLMALPVGILYMRHYRLPLWRVADIAFIALTVAHAFGRIGCLAAGCCYGKPTGAPWGIRLYSDLVERNMQGIPLHPTQLYEASALFVLFFGLLYIQRHKVFSGQVALTYFIAYPIIRSIIEIFRGDLIRGFVIGDWLSTSQFISLLVFLAASAVLYCRLRQVHRVGEGLAPEVVTS